MDDASPDVALEARPPKGRYVSDPDHTSVLWRIKHLALSWYTGRFTKVDIALDFDRDEPQAMRVEARIELRSVRMHYTGTDKDWDVELAEKPEFFDVKRTPLATFVSDDVRQTGPQTAEVEGKLTFRGVTRPVTFDATYNGAMTDHWSGIPMIGFSATATLSRSAFGLDAMAGPRLPDAVQIIVETELRPAPDG